MRLDPADPFAVVWLLGEWEPSVTQFIQGLLGPGAGFVDVGAHQGYYSLLASQVVGPNGHVFAFEPEPFNFSRLSENVGLNNATNVTAVRTAVGDYTGRAILHTAGVRGSGSHSLAPNVDPILAKTVGQVEVEITTLDAYFQDRGWPRVDVVKMDVEGAEMAVLSGMQMLCRRNPNLSVVLEFFPRALKAMGVDPRTAYGELQNLFGAIGLIDDRKGPVGVDSDWMVAEAQAWYLWARAPRVENRPPKWSAKTCTP
jgi:FkbM family methyltransferase